MKSQGMCVILILAFIIGLSLSTFAGMGSSNYQVTTSVMSGGGAIMQSGNYRVKSTLGQPSPLMAGDQNPFSTNYDLYPGFWYTSGKNWAPDTPLLLSPQDGSANVELTPTLQTDVFSDPDGDSHAQSVWQISSVVGDFSDNALVLSARSDTVFTSLTIPDHLLSVNTTYYWRAKFHDDRDAVSGWSDTFSFSTVTLDESDSDGDGVPEDQEVADPTLDMDDDGNPDVNQGDMKCVNTVVGDGQIGVKSGTNVDSIDSIKSIDPDTVSDTVNKPDLMPFGLISFKMTVSTPGDSAQVIVYLSEPAPSGAKWYKYNSINGWQDYSGHATFSADRTSVTLDVKDGDYGDADGVANGFIVDPSGAGSPPSTPPVPAAGGGGGGCFIATIAF
jgi:hypothetical protein